MPLIEFTTSKGEAISINPRHVVKLREKRLNASEPDAMPVYETTVTLAGGSQETVQGSRRDIERSLGAGV